VHLVRELVAARGRPDLPVLDPFAGTGTTLLVCAEQGIDGDSVDLNPLLRWLAAAKVARYSAPDRAAAAALTASLVRAALDTSAPPAWLPPLHHLDRWWLPARARALGRAIAALDTAPAPPRARDLARLAFCRALIDTANVSFGHQSLSFRPPPARQCARAAATTVASALTAAYDSIAGAAATPLPRATLRTHLDDARTLATLGRRRFGAIVTSPPYANRMSYVRELRPYLFWLRYLREPREAGELDWRAIGGTWGCATSRLGSWTPPTDRRVRAGGFLALVARITAHHALLGRYVHRYFLDLDAHVAAAFERVAPGGTVHYVVGNSAFYGVGVPTHDLLAEQLGAAGFVDPTLRVLRARTSKRGLFEFVVSARRP